jgi:hypothetical protein
MPLDIGLRRLDDGTQSLLRPENFSESSRVDRFT